MSNLTQTVDNKFAFIQITLDELLAMRESKVISESAYITMCLRFEQPYQDKELTVNVDEFTEKWGINRRAYYRCIHRLKKAGLFIVKKLKHVCKWAGVNQERTVTNTSQSETDTSSPVTDMSQLNTETLDIQEVQEPKYDNNQEIKEKVLKFVTNQFMVKFGETREKALHNAKIHLKDKVKYSRKEAEYLAYIEAKERSDERHRKTLQQQRDNQKIPVNMKALEMINQFLNSRKS